jgi:hypothetical protein
VHPVSMIDGALFDKLVSSPVPGYTGLMLTLEPAGAHRPLDARKRSAFWWYSGLSAFDVYLRSWLWSELYLSSSFSLAILPNFLRYRAKIKRGSRSLQSSPLRPNHGRGASGIRSFSKRSSGSAIKVLVRLH